MTEFELPGAPQFSKYLRSIVEGELILKGPEVLHTSYGVDDVKRWVIEANGELLGEYKTFDPKLEETEFVREYHGRIPGYVNEASVIGNQHLARGEKPAPTDLVGLTFANERCEYVDEALLSLVKGELTAEALERLRKEHPYFTGRNFPAFVATPWQRQDGHKTIPFP